MDIALQATPWSATRKFMFRFAAAYLFIYIFPFPLSMFGSLWHPIANAFTPFVTWVGRNVLLFPYVYNGFNGSGDKSYDYVQLLIFVVFAITAAVTWTFLDRRRVNYYVLSYWLRVAVRYYLAWFLVVYGSAKFMHGQFPAPDMYRLMQTYGESSPMGLAWTFFGFSTGYGVFMGIAECLGGLLILFRRTLLLGACIATAVTLNIFMVNLFYDVPVKLFSGHLLFMSAFLVYGEGRRFSGLFLLGRAVPALSLLPMVQKRWARVARLALKSVFIMATLSNVVFALMAQHPQEYAGPVSPLYGVYTVVENIHNGQHVSAYDKMRWHKLLIDQDGSAAAKCLGGHTFTMNITVNDTIGALIIDQYPQIRDTLQYSISGGILAMNGILSGDTVHLKLARLSSGQFLLTSRGFHWINETPYNR